MGRGNFGGAPGMRPFVKILRSLFVFTALLYVTAAAAAAVVVAATAEREISGRVA